jgi:hypothetical protein
MNKAERLAKAKRELDKTLKRTGFFEIQAKHKGNKGIKLPDYKVEQNVAPTSDAITNGFKVVTGAHHPDAFQFPVGNDHKSGYRLIIATDDLKYMAGKKT